MEFKRSWAGAAFGATCSDLHKAIPPTYCDDALQEVNRMNLLALFEVSKTGIRA